MLVARPVPERQLPRGRVHQDAAEREDVRPRAGLLAEDLLGRHEPGRADDHPGAGQQRLDGDLERAGDAEVDDAGAVDGEQHVGRLQVTVHDPGGVDAAQGPQQPLGQGVYGLGGQRPVFPYGLFQGGAGHIAGGHPGAVGVGVGVQDRGGVAAADAAGGLDLAAEAGPELPAGDVLLVDDLDGDRTAPRRTGQIDAAHAARAEPAEQRIGPDPVRITGHEGAYALHGRVPLVAVLLPAAAHADPIPRWPVPPRSPAHGTG